MRNYNLRAYMFVFLGISIVLWFGIAHLRGLTLASISDFVKILPTVVTIDMAIYGLFSKWGWRWRVFRGWLVPFPDLNGTWQGFTQSNYVDSNTNETLPPIRTMLVIRQSFGNMSCVMHTQEMTSHSFIEGLAIDRDRQIRQLIYSYSSQPKPPVRHKSDPHDGTIIFEIIEDTATKLVGRYWTDRESTGEVKLEFRCKDLLDEMPSEETES